MDQVLTGKFIAEERKKKGYSQAELASKLGITNKTVSKWETGKGFPDVSLLLPLCDVLDISVNELLSGKRLEVANYEEHAEANMVAIIEKNKKIPIQARVVTTMILLLTLLTTLTAENGLWLIFGVTAIITAIVNVVLTLMNKDGKLFGFSSLVLTIFTLCDFYGKAADWVVKEDWAALMDVLPYTAKTLWVFAVVSVIINSISLIEEGK